MKLILKTPKFWHSKTVLSYLLLPFSLIYLLCFIIHKLCSIKQNHKIFTIGVGNLTVGGSGKTPVCLSIARLLQQNNYNFVIITKGYGSAAKSATLVNSDAIAKNVGDESLIYAKMGYKTISSPCKTEGVKLAKKLGFDMVIVDDSLQTHKLHTDFNILVIDTDYGFGNNFLIPAGPMRQPVLNTYKIANAIILIGDGKFDVHKQYENKIYRANLITNKPNTSNYVAFCGIGRPEKFKQSLLSHNINITEFKQFPDHYNYTPEDIDNIDKIAKKSNAKIITTYKDWVKLDKASQEKIEYLKANLEINNNQGLISIIEESYLLFSR